MKLLVDVPDDLLLEALDEAGVSDEIAIDATATDAVVVDALRLWTTLENPRDVLAGRDDVADPHTASAGEHLPDDEAFLDVGSEGEEVSGR